ncbi:MAG: tRNA (adenosine(37)-N6)-dimethylallyltransferase MiaA [Bacillota bacterium]
MSRLQPVMALVGPTGVGKTELSLQLAERLGAEIVSADSMQVYRGMDIGTAKATARERERVPHHLIDLVDPDQEFSAAEYQERARAAIAAISARGHLPMLVGGTGLYVRAALDPYEFTEVEVDWAYREELRQLGEQHGATYLHNLLSEVDPWAAAKLHPNDLRRVIRALEVHHHTGERISDWQAVSRQKPLIYDILMIGLTRPREELYERIEARVDAMIAEGLVDELRRLVADGFDQESIAGQALGYKEFLPYLRGETTFDDAVQLLKRDTRRYAKRQLSWFRADPRVDWIDLSQHPSIGTVVDKIVQKVAERFPIG